MFYKRKKESMDSRTNTAYFTVSLRYLCYKKLKKKEFHREIYLNHRYID